MDRPPLTQPQIALTKSTWPPAQEHWTYEDWLKLPDDGYRYEVIDGVLHMSPPPRTRHQRISARLVGFLIDFLKRHPLGEILYAPVGVRLPNQPVPVEPDILFIKRERLDIITEEYVEGAPDLIIEILSPSNWLYDRREKMQAYQTAGVTEYWIVDPRAKTVEIYALEAGAYLLLGQYKPGEVAQSQVLPGFGTPVVDIFPM